MHVNCSRLESEPVALPGAFAMVSTLYDRARVGLVRATQPYILHTYTHGDLCSNMSVYVRLARIVCIPRI